MSDNIKVSVGDLFIIEGYKSEPQAITNISSDIHMGTLVYPVIWFDDLGFTFPDGKVNRDISNKIRVNFNKPCVLKK